MKTDVKSSILNGSLIFFLCSHDCPKPPRIEYSFLYPMISGTISQLLTCNFAYFQSDIFFRCAPGWELRSELPFTLYWLAFGFLIPLFTIIGTSIKTIWCLKKVSKDESF